MDNRSDGFLQKWVFLKEMVDMGPDTSEWMVFLDEMFNNVSEFLEWVVFLHEKVNELFKHCEWVMFLEEMKDMANEWDVLFNEMEDCMFEEENKCSENSKTGESDSDDWMVCNGSHDVSKWMVMLNFHEACHWMINTLMEHLWDVLDHINLVDDLVLETLWKKVNDVLDFSEHLHLKV